MSEWIMSTIFWLSISMFGGCDASKDKSPTAKEPPPSLIEAHKEDSLGSNSSNAKNDLPQDKIDFYSKEFPKARGFNKRDIPSDFLSEIDKSNSNYYEVLDENNAIIGYLRDFMGPVTSEENCACSPLSMTLAYNTDFTLRNIISVAPLQKYGHEPLTEEEQKQMVSIAKNPSPELLTLQAPQDMIDGSTGATSLLYRDKVVDKAGYSSWRISRLASETSQILQGAPIQRDMDRLQKKMQGAETPAAQKERLVEFIPTAESDYLKQRALFILAELYLQGLNSGEKTEENIESIILNTGLGSIQEAELLINLCLAFVEQKVANQFVAQCIERLEKNQKKEMFTAQISLLKGMRLFEQGKGKQALPFLEKGITKGEASPELRQKMALIYKELEDTKKACSQLEEIYLEAPRWPNLENMMKDCGDMKSTLKKIDAQRKKNILSTKIEAPKKISSMELTDESGALKKVDLKADGKKTVVVFFATWCPHCQKEMPRLVEFYNSLQSSKYKNNVSLLAVRASTARETQSFSDFKKQYNIPFTIMTDNGIAFENFAAEQGVSPGFPMMAVTNEKGEVAYFVSHGDYNDTAKELFWIIDSL
jgi:thiol-disulfide isomerase/thioredoxin